MTKFLKKAFYDMKENVKAQHEVDKANFETVKAESKATFEENKFHNSYYRAKEIGKQSWEDARMNPAERTAKMRAEQEKQIADAKERTQKANERYEKVKKQ